MSEQPTFQPSDLEDDSSSVDAWRKLADQMQPSQGAYSGGFKPGSTQSSDAQWLRRFNLTVYKASPPAQPAQVTTQTAIPQQNQLAKLFNLPSWMWRSPRDPIELPEVKVTAPAPQQPSQPAQPQQQSYPGLDLSNLRCQFRIQKSTSQSPNQLWARIYNLSPATMAKVIEFTRVQVQAGYWFSGYGIIFDGTVVQYLRGKENPVDSYLDIWAGDGDVAFNNGTIFKAMPAGSTVAQKFQTVYQGYKEQQADLTLGQNDAAQLRDKTYREHVMAGTARSQARELALSYNMSTHFDNGQWNIIAGGGYKKGTAVVLSPRTGLVGLPEVTQQGIQAKCLLNPRLKLGGLVKIDSQFLSGVPYLPGTAAQKDAQGNVVPGNPTGGPIYSSALFNQEFITAYTSPVGTYAIILMNYSGDTRGQPWYCDLVCLAVNGQGVVLDTPGSALQRASAETRSNLNLPPPPTTQTPPTPTPTPHIMLRG